MNEIAALWMPIVVSAVIVYFASSILWMATPLHKKDYMGLPDEGGILNLVKGLTPGRYMFPWCGKDWKDPAHQAKMNAGPWGTLIIPPERPNFAKCLIAWFVHQVVLAVFIAYVAGHALPLHAKVEYLKVFQVVGAVTLLAQGGMWAKGSIWGGLKWSSSLTELVDALVYALLTAGVYGWLWPRA